MPIEFYVIISFIAAAAIAVCARPSHKKAVRNFFYPATLSAVADGVSPAAVEPGIELRVLADGKVLLRREGLQGLRTDGSLCLAVAVGGFDVSIEERVSPGRSADIAVAAEAVLDCMGAERYNISYRCPHAGGISASFQLNIRPGNRIVRPLEI